MSYSPGWARTEPSMWAVPQPKFKPAVWRFADAKRALDASHNMVPAEQTERRNLIMVNPIEGNNYASTRNLVAAYQCVMAGDMARSHRHSAAALRLVLQAKPGTYTVVDGARVDMAAGDVVLTPAWKWHGHVNESDATSYWIDFLDIPFVQLTEAMFFEPLSARRARADHQRGRDAAAHRRGRGARARPRRQGGRGRQGRDADHRAASPAPAGRRPCRCREDHGQQHLRRHQRASRASTSRAVFPRRSGRGDVIAVPCWHAHRIDAPDDATIFRVTDAPILEKLGLMKTAAA